jgi:hypothetical protein
LRGHAGTIGERLAHDLAAFQKPLPAPYDACEKTPGSVSSLSLVRYRRNDYSVPTAFGHRKVLVRGYVHEVVIACGAEVIARHPRSYEREDFVFNPLHYLALIEQKTNALDQAAPLTNWTLPDEFDPANITVIFVAKLVRQFSYAQPMLFTQGTKFFAKSVHAYCSFIQFKLIPHQLIGCYPKQISNLQNHMRRWR